MNHRLDCQRGEIEDVSEMSREEFERVIDSVTSEIIAVLERAGLSVNDGNFVLDHVRHRRGRNMEDRTKSETNEIDAVTMRYNAIIQERGQEGSPFGDIEMDAKIIRLGLMNQPTSEEPKPKPRLRVVGGKDNHNASST